jgi:preprotein translocase subunit SecB
MPDSNGEPQPDAAPGVGSAQLAIQQVFLKDSSFEAPQSPYTLGAEWKPTVEVQLSNRAERLREDHHEVVLTITVTVRSNDKPVYLVEVQQAGIFTISGAAASQLGVIIATACPTILYPFAREVVADLVTRGGFPPLLLAPVNFDALYVQERKRREQEEQAARGPTH